MTRYSPKIDVVFQKIFSSEENKDLLLSLLNAVLNRKHPLTTITVKNPYNFAEYINSKRSIVDIKAEDDKGTIYDIEMQVGEIGMYGKRALYYLSKLYTDQIERGEDYESLNKVIGIHLLDFPYFPGDRYLRHLMLMDVDSKEVCERFDYQELYLIEMPKMTKDYDHLTTLLDRWISFLNRSHELNISSLPPEIAEEKTIVKAIEKLEVMNFSEKERRIYNLERKAFMDSKAEWRTALEKGEKRGEKIGIEKGRQIAFQESLQRLINHGMSEKDAKKILNISAL